VPGRKKEKINMSEPEGPAGLLNFLTIKAKGDLALHGDYH
jgi:hypothetical protein